LIALLNIQIKNKVTNTCECEGRSA